MYKFSCTHADILMQVQILDQFDPITFWYKIGTSWYKIGTSFFFPKGFCISLLDVLMCYVQVFMHTHRHLTQVKIRGQFDPVAFRYKIGTSFFIFSKEFFISIQDVLMCYVQVFMHTGRHLIQVKIPSQFNLVAFWYKIGKSFFFFFFLKNFAFLSWTS